MLTKCYIAVGILLSLNIQPSCCFDVVLYMLNCVLWRHIPLKMSLKVVLAWAQNSNQYTAQRYNL